MPYIKKQDREELDLGCIPRNAGELNYTIHLLLQNYMLTKDESYQVYNDIIGALEAAKMELYRRRVAPYEELKIKENGDIEFYNPSSNK
jgi:hypothetical protein